MEFSLPNEAEDFDAQVQAISTDLDEIQYLLTLLYHMAGTPKEPLRVAPAFNPPAL